MTMNDKKKTLTDADITTDHPTGRRTFLSAMGAAGAAAALTPLGAKAQEAADGDNGEWTDTAECPRGSGGNTTGARDQDGDSVLSDLPGAGRGAPYC